MPNPSNKQELLAAMADGYAQLNEQMAKMNEEAISAPFDFAADPKKCGVRWQWPQQRHTNSTPSSFKTREYVTFCER